MDIHSISFESLLGTLIHEELSQLISTLEINNKFIPKKYLTINEISSITGIGSYTLRQLTFARAMPHRKVKSRIIFDEQEISETIFKFKLHGWTDPDKDWDVTEVQSEINKFQLKKEAPIMIEEIFRKIIREEFSSFSEEIISRSKNENGSVYGRTILTIKEAAEHFRTSTATIYSLVKEDGMPHLKIQSRFYIVLEEAEAFLWRETAKSYADEGNIYWQRLLQRIDWEEKERDMAYKKALKRLEESTT